MADSATPRRLIVVLPTVAHHRVIAEIRQGPDGRHRIAISRWLDTASRPRQLGRSTECPLRRTSKLTALADAVQQALLTRANIG